MKKLSWIAVFIFFGFQEILLFAKENRDTSSLEILVQNEHVGRKNQHILLSHLTLQKKVLDEVEDEVFYENMTTHLLQFYQQKVDFSQLHELKELTEEIHFVAMMSTIEDEHQLTYKAILDFWMQFIFEQLQEIVRNDEHLKYTFDYQYIQNFGEQYQYQSFEKLSDAEKFIDHFSQNKWSYLWNRLLLRTTIWQKSILTVLSLGILFSIFYTIIHLFKRRKA